MWLAVISTRMNDSMQFTLHWLLNNICQWSGDCLFLKIHRRKVTLVFIMSWRSWWGLIHWRLLWTGLSITDGFAWSVFNLTKINYIFFSHILVRLLKSSLFCGVMECLFIEMHRKKIVVWTIVKEKSMNNYFQIF